MDAAFKANPGLKMVFICSPGNPTGTLIPLDVVRKVANNTNFTGLVVVDEAYIDFAPEGASACSLVTEFSNVCVMQTLSKSFGLAAIRLGFLLGSPELVQILTNAKAPYNVSLPTAAIGLQAMSDEGLAVMAKNTRVLNANRDALIAEITQIPNVGDVLGGNSANFIVVQILTDGKPDSARAKAVYTEMAENRGVPPHHGRHGGGEQGRAPALEGAPCLGGRRMVEISGMHG
jgi:histidinol-phosphate aminotransferase